MGSLGAIICGKYQDKNSNIYWVDINGVLIRKKSKWVEILENVEKVHRSDILTHSQEEKKIERGHEEEWEGSPIPIFPPPSFGIVRMHPGWMSFRFKI